MFESLRIIRISCIMLMTFSYSLKARRLSLALFTTWSGRCGVYRTISECLCHQDLQGLRVACHLRGIALLPAKQAPEIG